MGAPGDVYYARTSDGVDIAYTVFGEGPDLLVAPGFVTHLDLIWDLPPFQPILELGESFRVIVLDKRGTGLSDRSLGFGSMEDRTEDIRVVLDAVGSEQVILYGISESGPMSIYYTATHPERVRALVLFGTSASFNPDLLVDSETVQGTLVDQVRQHGLEEFLEGLSAQWGQGTAYQRFLSHPPDRDAAQRVLARYERSACTPQMCSDIMRRNFEMDVNPFLSMVSVPTLVMHCKRDPILPVEFGRHLGAGIPGARFVEIDGDFHGSWRREDNLKLGPPLAAFFAEVLGSSHSNADTVGARELATVLFTDFVASTERATEVGDAAWKAMLDRHERAAEEVIGRVGGRLIEKTGDGLLATFGGPSQAVAAARAVQDAALGLGVGVRAGIHTGEIERRGDRIGGIGVHIAARVMALANSGEVLASRTVRDLSVGSQLEFEDRGVHTLKGVSDPWQIFAIHV
jgi:class 3 adenylate cyclase/alpha-beta hydrolase superfamily lysophospholipase